MLECDVQHYGENASEYYEVTLAVALDLTDEQIERFNKEHENEAHIQRYTENPRPQLGSGPYLFMFKVYPEEHPTENAGPFESREEATKFLSLAWALSGDNTLPIVPQIQEKEK